MRRIVLTQKLLLYECQVKPIVLHLSYSQRYCFVICFCYTGAKIFKSFYENDDAEWVPRLKKINIMEREVLSLKPGTTGHIRRKKGLSGFKSN